MTQEHLLGVQAQPGYDSETSTLPQHSMGMIMGWHGQATAAHLLDGLTTQGQFSWDCPQAEVIIRPARSTRALIKCVPS